MEITSLVCRSLELFFFGIPCLFVFFRSTEGATINRKFDSINDQYQSYNHTYPITPPINSSQGSMEYRIGIIADLDKKATITSEIWRSFFQRGYLTKQENGSYSVNFDKESTEVESKHSYGGRGMELSELVVFNGELYSCDDKTGIVFKLSVTSTSVKPIPWVILSDGSGNEVKGFKCEWMTVKDEHLFVGGYGITLPHNNVNHTYIKKISMKGEVEHIRWVEKYEEIKTDAGITSSGYMSHEAVNWSPFNKQWLFLPRKASKEAFNPQQDEVKGTNFLLKMNSNYSKIEVVRVGNTEEIICPSHGFSSFKFIPNTNEQHIIALKSKEYNDLTASYIIIFDTKGNILLPERRIGEYKFEGIEFI